MFINNWLRDLNNDVLPRIRPRRCYSLSGSASRGYCPRALTFEPLEDRSLLTALLVDTLADNPWAGDVMDGSVSLREAITAANANAPFGDAPAGQGGGIVDSITFDVSLTGQTIVLGGVELAVSGDLSLTGLGAAALTISGNDASGVFWIEPDVTVDISQVTIADGAESYGAGIYNEGTLTVANSVLTNNSADGEGGAICNDAYYNDAATVTIINTTVSENVSDYTGGGIWNSGALNITNSTLTNNSVRGNGGGIANRDGGTVTITGSSFTGNSATSTGGGIDNYGGYGGNLGGELDIANSTFSGNSASSGGAIWSNVPAEITDSTIAGNSASMGGGISTRTNGLIIANSTIADNNSGSYGGGISIWGGTVSITRSTLAGNSTGREGGAIENYFGELKIINSTISDNSSDRVGGGIYNLGALEITNSTLSANRADEDGDGFGGGGGLYDDASDQLPLLDNTIVAGNLGGAAGNDGPDEVFGTLDPASSHNLIGDAATAGGLTHGADGNIVGNAGSGTIDTTTVLDPNLADNGGPTLTHALVPGGLAVNAGDNSKAVDGEGNALDYDQRGASFTRIVAGTVDIGAFEIQPLSVQIDVKPGSDTNSINLASNGVIAVAIFTTDDFDASLVNAGTVVFAGASAVHSALEDVDGDGDLDLILHFETQQTNLADLYAQLVAGDLNEDGVLDSNHQITSVSLTGQTATDEYFEAFDDVDLFLSGKNLRDFLEDLVTAGTI